MAKNTTTKAAKTPKVPHPCGCNAVLAYTVNLEDPNAEGDAPVYGPCEMPTMNEFTPGHDAKLKGVLIKLAVAGDEYRYVEGGLLITADPMKIAIERGWGHFLRAAIDRSHVVRAQRTAKVEAKAKAKAERDAAKAANRAANAKLDQAEQSDPAEIKAQAQADAEAKPAKRTRSRKAATKTA